MRYACAGRGDGRDGVVGKHHLDDGRDRREPLRAPRQIGGKRKGIRDREAIASAQSSSSGHGR